MPSAATKSKYCKISKSQILIPPHPQGNVMSVKCEKPLDELTVQVWLLNDHQNGYSVPDNGGNLVREERRFYQTDQISVRFDRQTIYFAKSVITSFLKHHIVCHWNHRQNTSILCGTYVLVDFRFQQFNKYYIFFFEVHTVLYTLIPQNQLLRLKAF